MIKACISPVLGYFKGIFTAEKSHIEDSMWTNKEPHEDLTLMWVNVTFLKDFGPWEKGHVAGCMTFCVDYGILSEATRLDSYGELIKECRVEFAPISV